RDFHVTGVQTCALPISVLIASVIGGPSLGVRLSRLGASIWPADVPGQRRMPRMMPDMPVPDAVELASRLVKAPSVSGSEGPAAQVLVAAMRDAGFDDARLDAVGNAVGIIDRGPGPTVLLTGHIDTVSLGDGSPGDPPPVGGAVVDGRRGGGGAVDVKSAVACMVQAAAEAKDAGFRGRLIVAGSVLEETNGFGSMHLARS